MIPESVMRELRYIEVVAKKRIRNLRAGTYTSPMRGDGFDFDEHRPYRPGDDVRRIDWNVTARFGMPFLRQTHAERELNLVVALDMSRSMRLGTRAASKREAATFITASLVFSAQSDQINTGFLAFTDHVERWSPPKRTGARAWQILEDLWKLEPKGTHTAIEPMVQHLVKALRRMSIIVIVSDFQTDEALEASGGLRILASKHDVVAVVPEDPSELALPAGRGFVRLRDLESGQELNVGLDRHSRRAHGDLLLERRAALTRLFYGLGIDHVFVRTDEPVTEPLLDLFARRRMR
jgi:uncharacterized protein (DUF58 family)